MMYAKAAENLERTEQRHSEDMLELMKEEKEQPQKKATPFPPGKTQNAGSVILHV